MGILSSFGSKVLASFGNDNFSMLRSLHSTTSKLKFLTPNDSYTGSFNNTRNLRYITNGALYGSIRNAECWKPYFALQNSCHKIAVSNSRSSSSRTYFKSIEYSDAEEVKLGGQNPKHNVKVFVFDLETTGLDRKEGRVIEIAIWDLQGGVNSCFQTLVNPEQDVKNSHIHSITIGKVRQLAVPRMVELIPIILEYIKSRQIPRGPALFIAHNAYRFGLSFLIIEFKCCLFQIPSDWFILDSLPLVREAMKLKLKESKVSGKLSLSLLKLGEYYGIPMTGSDHRAVSHVNLLCAIVEIVTPEHQLSD